MKNKILKLSSFLFAAIALSSCMKDKGYDNNEYQSLRGNTDAQQKVVSIALTTTDNSNITVTALNATPDLQSFNLIPVTLAGGVPATTDVHVMLDTSSAIVNDYNTANGTAVIPIPPSMYTLVNKEVIIPAGQTTGYVVVKFKPIDLLGSVYGFGFKIVSVDNGYKIAGNGKGQGLAMVTIKNAYDGVYHILAGTVTRYTAPGAPAGDALSGSLVGNPDIYLVTTGANTVTIPAPGSAGSLRWAYGSNSAVSGIDPLVININPSTNQVTVTSVQNPTLSNWSGHINSYDPVTKTFHISMRWNPTATVREYEVVMQYVGPRP